MGKWGELTPSTIIQIAFEVRDGEADPDDARRLLVRFCECVESGGPAPDQLIEHLRYAFRAYLKGGRTLESVLGLTRKKGRPKADERLRAEMAAEVLRHRLTGMSHQDALAEASAVFGWGITVVSEAWAAHKLDAVMLVRLDRHLDHSSWTPEEVERLCDMFEGEPWFIAPGKSPNWPA